MINAASTVTGSIAVVTMNDDHDSNAGTHLEFFGNWLLFQGTVIIIISDTKRAVSQEVANGRLPHRATVCGRWVLGDHTRGGSGVSHGANSRP